ncbi:MAG: hypothetical protein F4Y01_02300 [Gammaproteobacteria bacterium]|nr:hypothetical protein [Gammaproteobacteria bacterium]
MPFASGGDLQGGTLAQTPNGECEARMGQERVYCSDLCLASGEPMLGTAVQVDVWLLLEYRPAWRRKAVDDNDLAPETLAWLRQQVGAFEASGRKVRPQLVRRPGRDDAGVAVFVAQDGCLGRLDVGDYRDLAGLNLTEAELEVVSEPHYFVCTNGQRDLCCARYGLPAWTRLQEAVGERAWQTTHVGGHRFAPNVLVLPQGALYGRVTEDSVAAFVETIEAGDLAKQFLRGRSMWPPEAQAAEALLEGASTLKAVHGEDVTFATASGEKTVRVRRASSPWKMIPSCGVTEPEDVFPFVSA